jgi:hypothetical protein
LDAKIRDDRMMIAVARTFIAMDRVNVDAEIALIRARRG